VIRAVTDAHKKYGAESVVCVFVSYYLEGRDSWQYRTIGLQYRRQVTRIGNRDTSCANKYVPGRYSSLTTADAS
jgi:hypothetical protein